MPFSKWFRGKKSNETESANPKPDMRNREASAAGDGEIIFLLKRMIAEEPDLSSFDLDKLQESIAIGQRHAQTLRSTGNRLIPGLSQALSHSDPRIRSKGCWALQIMGSDNGLPDEALVAMAGLIADNDPGVRQQVAGSLGVLSAKVNLAIVQPQILAALKSTDKNVRKSIVELLGKMGANTPAVLNALSLMLNDQDVDVAETARAAIIKLGGKVEAPAPGSSDEVERLASLTTSSDYEIKKNAWIELEKLTDRERAIPVLMKVFRSHGGKGIGTKLPEFLGKVGTDACLEPLLEIIEYARRSKDEWEQKYLTGSACAALLKIQEDLPVIRSKLPLETLGFIIMHGLISANEKERPAIAAKLTEEERRKTIAGTISLFRSSSDKDSLAWGVSNALGSLGVEAVEPILEIFRGVKPAEIQPNGSIKEGDDGKDGPPAAAMVRIPGGIEKIRAVCTAEEYERILVRAHQYGDSGNPALNQALGEISTPKAIGRLLFVLWQSQWEEERRKPAREALIKTGKKAHEELLKAFEIKTPANREFQTSLRKEVLAVLAESGDELCIPAIQAVLISDPIVAENAIAALDAIKKRCGVNEAPEISAPQSLPLKKIARTGDPYVDDCFSIDFDELYDGREWFKMPEAKAVPDAANAGLTEESLHLVEELRNMHPDYYFSYYWLAVLYRKQKRYDEARKALLKGLNFSRSKQSLCTALGDLEWEQRDLSAAVKWWIKSVAVQVGAQYATDYPAFLYLSYVAEGLGIRIACSELRSWVDGLRSGQIRLNAQAANEFYGAVNRQGTPAMRLAIELLEKQYLVKQEG